MSDSATEHNTRVMTKKFIGFFLWRENQQRNCYKIQPDKGCLLPSHVQFFGTPWTIVLQTALSMKFSRREYWSGLSFSPSGDLPDTEVEPRSPELQADSLPSGPPRKPGRE